MCKFGMVYVISEIIIRKTMYGNKSKRPVPFFSAPYRRDLLLIVQQS